MSRPIFIVLAVAIFIAAGTILYVTRPSPPSPAAPSAEGLPEPRSGATEPSAPAPAAAARGAEPAPARSASTGRVVVFVANPGPSLDALDALRMTIDEIAVMKSGSWTALTRGPQTLDLVSLWRAARVATAADANLGEGTYGRIRIRVSNIELTERESGGIIQSVLIPSDTLVFAANLVVKKGAASAIKLDLAAAKGLYRTTGGSYIFFPVVRAAMQHDVSVQGVPGGLYTTGGVSDFDATLGMDDTGAMKNGFAFPAGTHFGFVGRVIRVIAVDEAKRPTAVSDAAAVDTALRSPYMDTALSIETGVRAGATVWKVTGLKNLAPVTVWVDGATGRIVGKE